MLSVISIPMISACGVIISSTVNSSIPKIDESISLDCIGIKSPCSSNKVLNASEFKLSFEVDSIGSTLNSFSILELMIFVNHTKGFKIDTNAFKSQEDLVAKFSG